MKNQYFVSVFVDHKCYRQFFSKDLSELPFVFARYSRAVIEVFDIPKHEKFEVTEEKIKQGDEIMTFIAKRGKSATMVRCVETDVCYASANDAAKAMGVNTTNIYQSIHSGYATKGLHFEYAFTEENMSTRRNLDKI